MNTVEPTRGEEVDLLDVFILTAKYKWWLLGTPFLAAVITAGITLLLPNIYTGTAVIMPPQQQSSAAAALLGALSGAGGVGLPIARTPSDLYVEMLKSRTVADALIARFDLKALYGKDTLVDTRKALEENTSISSGREGLITIKFDDYDPKRAADVANAYIEELDRLTQSIAISEASQRRLFFERQLEQVKYKLAEAEVALKKTQEDTGILRLDDQGRVILEAAAALRAQISAKEVELEAALRTFATPNNPSAVRLRQELDGLRSQLRKMEQSQVSGAGDILVPTGKVPEAGLEYIRKVREVKYYETLFEFLAKQFEVAKLEESKDFALIQVVEKAIALDYKSKPRRTVIVIVVSLIVGFMTLVGVFVWESLDRARFHDEGRYMALKHHLEFK